MTTGAVCTVVCDAADHPVSIKLELPALPISLGEVLALAQAHASLRALPIAWGTVPAGIWGNECPRSQSVRPGDRVEIYRRLPRDPKQARRARARAARRASGTVK